MITSRWVFVPSDGLLAAIRVAVRPWTQHPGLAAVPRLRHHLTHTRGKLPHYTMVSCSHSMNYNSLFLPASIQKPRLVDPIVILPILLFLHS